MPEIIGQAVPPTPHSDEHDRLINAFLECGHKLDAARLLGAKDVEATHKAEHDALAKQLDDYHRANGLMPAPEEG